MKGGRRACRVELTEAAHGLAGGQRLHSHAELWNVGPVEIGPLAPVPHEVGRELVQDLDKVIDPQDDQIVGLLASVDDDAPNLEVIQRPRR